MTHPTTQKRMAKQRELLSRLATYGDARESFGNKKSTAGFVERKRDEYKQALQALIEAAQEEGAEADCDDWNIGLKGS